jgi:hypothetical protein
MNYSARIVLPSKNDELVEIYQGYIVQDDVIEFMSVGLGYEFLQEKASDLDFYLLHNLLSTYGPPEEVYIQAFSVTPSGSLPFYVELFYPQQGFTLSYNDKASLRDDQIQVCIHDKFSLSLWTPGSIETFNDLARVGNFPADELPLYRPLQEVTAMDVETFYDTFKNSDNPFCLETPAELW